MTWRNPQYLQNPDKTVAAVDDRLIIDTLFSEGILNVGAGQGLVVQRPAGANMQVYVPPLDVIIKGDDLAGQNSYLARMSVAEFVDVTAAPTTNPRIDLLVAEMVDSQYRTIDTANPEGPRLRLVAGAPAATPVVPTLPPTAVALAQIAVGVNVQSIVAANITDVRTQAGAASLKVGTQIAPLTQAQRDALTAPFDGQGIYNLTQAALEAADASTATWASTRPLGLFFGNGSDGDVTIVGTVTLTRDMQYRNLTVPVGTTLLTNGYRIQATGVVRNAGTISCDGGPGQDGTYATSTPAGATLTGLPGGAGGGSLGAAPRRLGQGGPGGSGSVQQYDSGNGTATANANPGGGVSDAYGGNGGTGGQYVNTSTTNAGLRAAGGTNQPVVPAPTSPTVFDILSLFGIFGLLLRSTGVSVAFQGGAGGGGGGWGGSSSGALFYARSASGGGGGGVLLIVAEVLINTGTISARGGKGGNAATGAPANGAQGGSGPGGGGGGGVVGLYTRRIRDTGSVLVDAGAAGTGTAALAPAAGVAGSIYKIGV